MLGVNEGGSIRAEVRRAIAAVCPGLTVARATVAQARALAARLRGSDLLVAFSAPPPRPEHELAIGIAGRGFGGELTSDSTHTDGLVVSTDLAPTILGRLGVRVPAAMDGQPITSSGGAAPTAAPSRASTTGSPRSRIAAR